MDRDQNEVVEDILQPSLRKLLLDECKILEVKKENDLRYNFTRKHPSELRNWSIFNLLSSEFISQIYMVMIFANGEANAAIIATTDKMVYANGEANAAIIATRDKMVYALGNNVNGQLGLEDVLTTRNRTLYPRKIEILCGKVIKKFVYCSKMCNSALTEKGEVYLWGNNKRPSRTIGSVTFRPPYQMKELNNEYIIDIACGTKYFLFLTKDGKVYFWGKENFLETYIADVLDDSSDDYIEVDIHASSLFVLINVLHDNLKGKKVVFIACGANFNIAVTDEDQVYSWGCNSCGQLGINDPPIMDTLHSFKTTPYKITTLSNKRIVKVVCGYAHTLALTNEGKLYTWGINDYGQSAMDRMNSHYPIMLKIQVKILDIAAVGSTSVALGSDGHIYIWGYWFGDKILEPMVTRFSNIYDVFTYDVPYMTYNLMFADEYEHIYETSNILKCLETEFDNSETSDFIIEVEGKSIHVHKFILIIRSLYFRNMFKHNGAKKDQNVIEHKQFSYIVYKAFLKYLYTEVIDLPVEEALELLDLANAYCDTKLKKHCNEFIKKGLTLSNVIAIYIAAIQGNIKDLEEYSFQFILKNTTAVVSQHFITMENKLRLDLTFRLAEAGAFKT